jgi:hypothetical protein
LSKAPSGVILNLATIGLPSCDDSDAALPLGVGNDEEPTLRVPVETKAILAVPAAGVRLMDGLRVEEGLSCEAEVEAAFFVDLVALVLIPLKLQILQGFSGYCWLLLPSGLWLKDKAVLRWYWWAGRWCQVSIRLMAARVNDIGRSGASLETLAAAAFCR